jgi:hypothetical protein
MLVLKITNKTARKYLKQQIELLLTICYHLMTIIIRKTLIKL